MSKQVLTDAKIFFDGYDFSGDMNSVALDHGSELQDQTTFDCTTRARLGGLKTVAVQIEGLWEAGAGKVDTVLFDALGDADKLLSICPLGYATGERAFFLNAVLGGYNPSASVGEIFRFSISAECASNDLIRGFVLKSGTVTSSSTSTPLELGAVAEGQYLYGALHASSVSASDTITVVIQSDDNEAFTSPTTRYSFTVMSAIGAQFATPVAGPITDTWWRVSYTVAGADVSITFLASMGIQ